MIQLTIKQIKLIVCLLKLSLYFLHCLEILVKTTKYRRGIDASDAVAARQHKDTATRVRRQKEDASRYTYRIRLHDMYATIRRRDERTGRLKAIRKRLR